MTNDRLLVTGATGFIGRHLMPRLRRDGHSLVLIVRSADRCPAAWRTDPHIRIVELGAIETNGELEEVMRGVQGVVHLAGLTEAQLAPGQDAEVLLREANTVFTSKLAAAALACGARTFVHASSIAAITGHASEDILGDATRPTPGNAYGRSKLEAEQALAAFAGQGTTFISLRMPLVIGADTKGNWAALQKLAVSGLPLPFGSIRNRRSLISVASAADLIAQLVSRTWPQEASGAYCVTDTGAMPIGEIVAELRHGMGRPARIVPFPLSLLRFAATLLNQRRRADSLLGSLEVDDTRFRRTFGYNQALPLIDAIRHAGATTAAERAQTTPAGHGSRRSKRFFDLLLAAAAFPIAVPMILLCVAAVRATSRGPAIFRQARVGMNERLFTCYKLRTMHIDTGDMPSHEAAASAVTPVGRWLRRLKLDELPQLWNILRGDMSFVGPRPCLPSQTVLIAERRARGLYSIRPGITGVSQVAGVDMSEPERLAELDATYLGAISMATDLRLIIATVLGAGRGDAVRP